MRQLYDFEVTFLRRQLQPQPPKSVVELLAKTSIPSTATRECCPELDEALGRFREAQRARETQAELADRFASEYVDALVGATFRSGTQRPSLLLKPTTRPVP
jgi:hypothetical protein